MTSTLLEKALVVACLACLGASGAFAGSPFVVSNTNDAGAGSLRQAILDANGTLNGGGPDLISFAIPGAGPHTITTSGLPLITDPVVIDGTTQGVSATPLIELNGANVGSHGLWITAGGSTVRGLAINRFPRSGIYMTGSGGNTIQGNFVGTDPGGTLARPNGEFGVFVDGPPDNLVGGTQSGARNLISANTQFAGVAISGSTATNNRVEGNYIGTDVTGTLALGNGNNGVYVGNSSGVPGSPSNCTVGGTAPGAGNLISGNGNNGVEIYGPNASGNRVQGNFIGTNAAGTGLLGNGADGVNIGDASGHTIGGTEPGARNIISGSGQAGVRLVAYGTQLIATNNFVQGNYIGTDVNGTTDLGNIDDGVTIDNAPGNTIGGTASGTRNVISGNNDDGVSIFGGGSTGNQVQGNFIGTDVNGTADLGNSDNGVRIEGAPSNTIGGTTSSARNVISGNNDRGVRISGGASLNQVQGNFIGTDVTGTIDVGNTSSGVRIEGASNNTIGGTTTGVGNLISGNNDDGIFIEGGTATNNRIQGNLIGTKANGIDALGNTGDGIDFSSASPAFNNTIGGISSGEPNVIAFNGNRGVFVSGGTGNGILSNSIFSNVGLGIDLGPAGVTPNDPGDGDTGPNGLQNFPVLTSATTSGGNTTIQGTLNSTANTTFRVEFFSNPACDPSGNGEGQTFIGATDVTTVSNDATINTVLPVTVAPGQFVSATATDPVANTSEFSACVVVTGTAPSPTPTPIPSTLGNISTRLRVETGDNVLIGGFILTGTQPKKIIVRAIGPSLPLAGALADPILELRNSSGGLIFSNDNWRSDQEAEIIATTIPPSNDLESAIVATLPANNSAYTAIVRGVNNGTGIGVVEGYDLDQTVDSKLANISTRGFVQTGDNVLIGGLIVLGQNPLRVIVRAIGPSLPLPGALGDPTLSLHDGNGAVIVSNDNWRTDQEAEIIATTIPPSNDLESAIVRDLAPGNYTAIVRGVNSTTGIAVVEAYGLN